MINYGNFRISRKTVLKGRVYKPYQQIQATQGFLLPVLIENILERTSYAFTHSKNLQPVGMYEIILFSPLQPYILHPS